MINYQLSGEGHVFKIEGGVVTTIPTVDNDEHPNRHPEYIGYKKWIDGGGVPLPKPEGFKEPVPVEISRAQGKAILTLQGIMPSVQSYIDAITEQEESMWASLAMNDAAVWRRYDSPFLLKAAAALGLTDEQLDELFIAASKIVI